MTRLNIKGIYWFITCRLYIISTISNFTFWTTSDNCRSYILKEWIVSGIGCSIKRIHTNFNSTLFTIVKCFKVRISCFFNLLFDTFTKKSKSCKKITARRPRITIFRILTLKIPNIFSHVRNIFFVKVELLINCSFIRRGVGGTIFKSKFYS